MSNFQPIKVFNPTNPSDFLIANSQSELIQHIVSFANRQITPESEPYFNYNNVFADEFFNKLRPHQKEAVSELSAVDIGQCILPTGCGKTMIQQALILKDAMEKQECQTYGKYLIGCHRLLLSKQLIIGIIEIFKKCELPFNVLIVNSDNHNNSDFKLPIDENLVTPSTVKSDIDTAFRRATLQKRHLLIVSTYHSIDRLLNKYVDGKLVGQDNKIDIVAFDEAHELVKAEFKAGLEFNNQINKKYFFTATPKLINEIDGMANYNKFGRRVYEKSPRQMIDVGEIASPKLHILKCNDENASSQNMKIKTVIECFNFHEKCVKTFSFEPSKINPKLLICCESIDQMKEIIENEEFQEFCRKNNIRVIAFSSVIEKLKPSVDFISNNKDDVYNELMNLQDDEKAIIFHYDMLSEGIDLPSITGVALFRGLGKSKMLQSIGRCLRLNQYDRQRLYSGEISVGDTDKLIKQFGWILIPEFFNPDMTIMRESIENIYTEYKIPNEVGTIIDSSTGIPIPDLEDVIGPQPENVKNLDYRIHHELKDIQQKFILDVIANLSVEDLLYWSF